MGTWSEQEQLPASTIIGNDPQPQQQQQQLQPPLKAAVVHNIVRPSIEEARRLPVQRSRTDGDICVIPDTARNNVCLEDLQPASDLSQFRVKFALSTQAILSPEHSRRNTLPAPGKKALDFSPARAVAAEVPLVAVPAAAAAVPPTVAQLRAMQRQAWVNVPSSPVATATSASVMVPPPSYGSLTTHQCGGSLQAIVGRRPVGGSANIGHEVSVSRLGSLSPRRRLWLCPRST